MKRVPLTTLATVLALSALITGRALAQEKAAGPSKPPAAEKSKDADRTPEKTAEAKPKGRPLQSLLRVHLVVTRYQGERKTGSAPYSFLVLAGDPKARVRMGVEAPIAVVTPGSYQYKNLGTSIDCSAEERGPGIYVLNLSVENSSAYAAEARSASSPPELAVIGDRPLFRSFSVALNPVLRDRQTIQAVASTDPISGEVVKIDVTLEVVK